MSLTITWLLFSFFFICLVVSSVLLPRFLVSFIRQWQINVTFLGLFILAVVTSLPELLTVLLFPSKIDPVSGIVKSFSVVLGSNLITGAAFCLLSLFYFRYFAQLTITKAIHWSSWAVILINGFFLLVLLYPQSFLNFRLLYWSLFGLLFVILYFLLLFYFSLRGSKNSATDQLNWDFNKIPFKSNPFALFIWIVVLTTALVGSVLILIDVTTTLQQFYQFSDWTIGSIFFAFATTSPEIWTALSLYHLGFGLAAWGVIVGSHLFNWILLFLTDFTTRLDIFQTLSLESASANLLELTFAGLFLSSLLHLLSWKVFRTKKIQYLLFPLVFLTVTFSTLLKLG